MTGAWKSLPLPRQLRRADFLWGKLAAVDPILRVVCEEMGTADPLRYAPSKNISMKGPQNCRSLGCPGFPVESDGFRKAHAAFLDESRKRGHLWCRVVGNPGTLGMTKGRVVASVRIRCWLREPQVPPLRYASVGMTNRSLVEDLVVCYPSKLCHPDPGFLSRSTGHGSVCAFR